MDTSFEAIREEARRIAPVFAEKKWKWKIVEKSHIPDFSQIADSLVGLIGTAERQGGWVASGRLYAEKTPSGIEYGISPECLPASKLPYEGRG